MRTPCWMWTASCGHGYGRLNTGERVHRAHRVAWGIAHGSIPDGLCVLHKCDNPPCVNVDHLFLGTLKDNVRDMVSKGRSLAQAHPERLARGDRHGSRTHPECLARGDRSGSRLHPESCARGERNGRAKITEHEIRSIFRLSRKGWSQVKIAEKLGVHYSNISLILARKRWAHVQMEAT